MKNIIAAVILILGWLAAMVLLGILVPAGHPHFIVGLFGAVVIGVTAVALIVTRD